MTHEIVGPCHPHLLDSKKLVDSVGTPLLEFIAIDATLNSCRAQYIQECINQCLKHGLPKELIERYESVNTKRSDAVRRCLKSLIKHIRSLSKNHELQCGEQFLIDKSINNGEKLILKYSKSLHLSK